MLLAPVIFPFVELPHMPGGWPRPVLDVVVGTMGEGLPPCLVDSGAMNTLLPSLGRRSGRGSTARTHQRRPSASPVPVRRRGWCRRQLTIGEHSWEAEVGFCDPWPRGWGLLGQLSFFRYFVVTLPGGRLRA